MPFSTPERTRRYDTSRYQGGVGLNWYDCDPTLQFLMARYIDPPHLGWATPHLRRIGALMGGPVARRAEETDRNPPRLEKYDRWGHDISEVVIPETAKATKRDLLEHTFSNPLLRDEARRRGIGHIVGAADSYMLNQAEIGMTCAIGTGGDMVYRLVEQFAPEAVKEKVLPRYDSGEWFGESAQLLTERTGGSDLAEMETTATPAREGFLLNGVKWFASNANGQAWVVLAKTEGAPDGLRAINSFLVLRERLDGTRNGVRIRQLKDKLGTKAVASAEVEFVDAEAFLLSGQGDGASGPGDGKGLTRMMELTNASRLGIANMGLGCARRALVEALCYSRAREAFGRPLDQQPLMRRKLAEMIVDVEAAQALVFETHCSPHRLRIGAPLAKLIAARLGITAASDAIEIHGGNGYVESWPVARLLRDAQVNTIWEGPDNILCLDVRRGIERQQADEPFMARLRQAIDNGPAGDPTVAAVGEQVMYLADAIERWQKLPREVGEARLVDLSLFMAEVYAGALLVEQAGLPLPNADRKALVAKLYARRHLSDRGPLRGLENDDASDLTDFDALRDGALAV